MFGTKYGVEDANPRVHADLMKNRAEQERIRSEINALERKMVLLNNIDRNKRQVGFDNRMKELVDDKKTKARELSRVVQIGMRLKSVLHMAPDAEVDEDTMNMIKKGKKLGVGEATRQYMEQKGHVVPAKHHDLPFPPKVYTAATAAANSHLRHNVAHHPLTDAGVSRASHITDMIDAMLSVGDEFRNRKK
jgi:hypothetical protein